MHDDQRCSDASDDTVSTEAEEGYTTTTLSASLTLRVPPPAKYRVEHSQVPQPSTPAKYRVELHPSQVPQTSTPAQPSTPAKYRVEHEPRCGRLLVATAHIAAGDTVLVDTPACLGPDNNTRPGNTRTLCTRLQISNIYRYILLSAKHTCTE